MNAIKVSNLTMKFKDTVALNRVNVSFEQNKIYGLLGRNGAGKSTLLNAITNKIFPTEGEIYIDDMPACENDKALSRLYCMSEKTLYSETSKIKNLFKETKIFYPDFDIEYATRLAEKFELNINKRVKELSTGYSSIFKLIIALSVNIPYVLLDEPILGLDANHRDLFYKVLLENYSKNPKTIIISTHLIEEVSDLIEQVVIVKKGEIILDKSADEVLQMAYCVSGNADEVDLFVKGKNVLDTETFGGTKTAYIMGKREQSTSLQVTGVDLQKLFILLTNV